MYYLEHILYTGIPQPTRSTTDATQSLLQIHGKHTRVPSRHMREITRGKFVVKYEDITLLEAIGEGIAKGVTWGGGSGCQLNFHLTVFLFISGEFGIVYKGKVSCTGRPAREVAVKTLKGWFL